MSFSDFSAKADALKADKSKDAKPVPTDKKPVEDTLAKKS